MLKPFLVTSRISHKTFGAVYAASLQSAQSIADTLWKEDKDALYLFDLREKFDGIHASTTAMAAH